MPGDHCRWCPCRAVCPALQQLAVEVAQREFVKAEPAPAEVGHDRLLWLLKNREAIQQVLDDLPKVVLDLMRDGVEFTGWKAVKASGNRAWIADDATIEKRLRGRGIGKKMLYKAKLLSPAQVEALGHGDKIGDLVTRSDIGYRVVKSTAKGEAVKFTPAVLEFENLDSEENNG